MISRAPWLRAPLLVLLLAALAACRGPFQPAEDSPDLASVLTAGQFPVHRVFHLDADNDGVKEWVVFYPFDQGSRRPIAGAVYDADRGNPPIVYPYLLHPIELDYLSEDEVSAEMRDVIREPDLRQPRLELVVWGITAGTPTELSIFRQLDRYYTNDVPGYQPWEPPTDTPRRYELVGFFRGNAGVTLHTDVDPPQVAVQNRDVLERSQFVVRRTYVAQGGTFLKSTSPQKLEGFDPVESTIDFLDGVPADVAGSPYQEKLVLAYYRGFDNRDLANSLLTSPAQSALGRDLVAGCGRPASELRAIQVDGIAYVPLVENAEQFSAAGVDPTHPR